MSLQSMEGHLQTSMAVWVDNNNNMKASGGFGTRWMTDLINNIVKDGCIPDDWRKSILVPVYKGKCDPLVCGSYRAIKLLEQPMKVLESVGKEDQMAAVN